MSNPVVIVGISGFGRETADVLDAMGTPIAGFVDDGPNEANLELLRQRNVPFLGSVDEWLATTEPGAEYVIGIGSGRIREQIANKLEAAGHVSVTAIHPMARMG